MTSKERAALRSLANPLTPVVFVGKEGVTENIVKQADDVLKVRELVKGTVQKNAGVTAEEACRILAQQLQAEEIQVIGRRFTLYRKKPQEC